MLCSVPGTCLGAGWSYFVRMLYVIGANDYRLSNLNQMHNPIAVLHSNAQMWLCWFRVCILRLSTHTCGRAKLMLILQCHVTANVNLKIHPVTLY